MATVRIMYWKEIPAQIQASDKKTTLSRPLPERFQEGIDALAMLDGSQGTDEYLMAWEWGDEIEVRGTAEEAALVWAERIDAHFPQDFVLRIRRLDELGKRDPRPGALDDWMAGES